MNPSFQILYDEMPVFAVNKPSGLLIQSPPGIDSLVGRIKEYLKAQNGRESGDVYLGVPHRLDRPATGVMIFARHVRAARKISQQFEMRMVEKKYWVCVEGNVPEENGSWEDFIRKVPNLPQAEIVSARHEDARWALLNYHVLRRFTTPLFYEKESLVKETPVTCLEIQLGTGRTHQIRIQAASRGFPVLGDAQYGARSCFGTPFPDMRLRAIALHSRSLTLKHPMRDEILHLEAPLPDAWSLIGIET